MGSDMGGSPCADSIFFEKFLVNSGSRNRAASVARSVGADQNKLLRTGESLYFPGANKLGKIYREKVLVSFYFEFVEFRGKLRRARVVKNGVALARARALLSAESWIAQKTKETLPGAPLPLGAARFEQKRLFSISRSTRVQTSSLPRQRFRRGALR